MNVSWCTPLACPGSGSGTYSRAKICTSLQSFFNISDCDRQIGHLSLQTNRLRQFNAAQAGITSFVLPILFHFSPVIFPDLMKKHFIRVPTTHLSLVSCTLFLLTHLLVKYAGLWAWGPVNRFPRENFGDPIRTHPPVQNTYNFPLLIMFIVIPLFHG